MQQLDVSARLAQLFEENTGELGSANVPQLVVWDDPMGEFAHQAEELVPEGVEFLCDEESTRFATKRRVNELSAGDKAVLYRQRVASDIHGDWFADAVLWGRHFQADLVSLQLEELGCVDTAEMRQALTGYRTFFSKKMNMKRVRALSSTFKTPAELHLAVIASVLRCGSLQIEDILTVYVSKAYAEYVDAVSDEEASEEQDTVAQPEVLSALEKAGALPAFERLVQSCLGYEGSLQDTHALVEHILFTALAATLGVENLKGLEDHIAPACTQTCHAVVRAWAASPEKDVLLQAAEDIESHYRLPQRFAALSIDVLMNSDVFPCIGVCIAQMLLRTVASGSSAAQKIEEAWDRRRTMLWFDDVKGYYQALNAAGMLENLNRAHADGFHQVAPKELWDAYTAELYQVDAAYRAFDVAYQACLPKPIAELDDELKAAADAVENLYKNWFLTELNTKWFDLTAAEYAESGAAQEIPRLTDFTASYVDGATAAGKVVVIISDALRFEVASELAELLERTTQGQVTLESMQAPFPSITTTGMAGVLPHGKLELTCGDDGLKITANSFPTANLQDREAVLQEQYPKARAVRYANFIAMKRDERLAYMGDATVLYIYHNAIDACGDDAKTEATVFDACERAVEELSGLVEVITRQLRISQVFITADHGFLYTRGPLHELAYISLDTSDARVCKVSRRYVLTEAGMSFNELAKVSLQPMGGSSLSGFTPCGCERIRRSGMGENYVHGGISLQEVCVPVVRFKNLRKGSAAFVEAEPVMLEPIDPPSVISNTLFKLRLLQTEAVGGKKLPYTYEVFIADKDLEPVSEVVCIVADKRATDPTERELVAHVELKPGSNFTVKNVYYLVVRQEDTKLVIWQRQVTIDVPFSPMEDFGW